MQWHSVAKGHSVVVLVIVVTERRFLERSIFENHDAAAPGQYEQMVQDVAARKPMNCARYNGHCSSNGALCRLFHVPRSRLLPVAALSWDRPPRLDRVPSEMYMKRRRLNAKQL
jgi:hypothetical protein